MISATAIKDFRLWHILGVLPNDNQVIISASGSKYEDGHIQQFVSYLSFDTIRNGLKDIATISAWNYVDALSPDGNQIGLLSWRRNGSVSFYVTNLEKIDNESNVEEFQCEKGTQAGFDFCQHSTAKTYSLHSIRTDKNDENFWILFNHATGVISKLDLESKEVKETKKKTSKLLKNPFKKHSKDDKAGEESKTIIVKSVKNEEVLKLSEAMVSALSLQQSDGDEVMKKLAGVQISGGKLFVLCKKRKNPQDEALTLRDLVVIDLTSKDLDKTVYLQWDDPVKGISAQFPNIDDFHGKIFPMETESTVALAIIPTFAARSDRSLQLYRLKLIDSGDPKGFCWESNVKINLSSVGTIVPTSELVMAGSNGHVLAVKLSVKLANEQIETTRSGTKKTISDLLVTTQLEPNSLQELCARTVHSCIGECNSERKEKLKTLGVGLNVLKKYFC